MLQQVSATRLLHKDYLHRLEEAHRRAQAELAANRATQRGDFNKTGRMRDDCATMERAKREFEGLYQRSLLVAEHLSAERTIISKEDAWLSQFGDGVVLEPVEVMADGVDHAQLRSEISVLRAERDRILKAPAAADRALVEVFVDELRRPAREQIDRLIANYPHFARGAPAHGIVNDLLVVMTLRAEMIDYLCERIDARAEGVMPVRERSGRLEAIDGELEQLLRIDAALVDRRISEGSTDVTHDKDSAPWITLGVKAEAREMKLAS